MEAPNTYRCSSCDINWPHNSEYRYSCPGCNKSTWETRESDVLTYKQAEAKKEAIAESRRKHEEFERYYAEREKRREKELAVIAHLDPDQMDGA